MYLEQNAEPIADVIPRASVEAQASAHLILTGMIALGLTLVIVQIATAVFMFRKSRRFPQMFIWATICTILERWPGLPEQRFACDKWIVCRLFPSISAAECRAGRA